MYQDYSSSSTRSYFRLAVFLFFTLVALAVAARHAMVVLSGRHYWTLGDWQINYGAGFVRRGITGSATFLVSDVTGLSLNLAAGAMQILLYFSVAALTLYLFSKVRWSGPVLMLLFSPVFLLMPFYYMHMSMSKELIGFLGLGLMASAVSGRNWLLWIGIATFAVAGFAHEVNAFLAPAALGFPLLFLIDGTISRRQALLACAAILAVALAALVSATLFQGQGMSQAICDQIVAHGGSVKQCKAGGPIGWLERDTAFGFAVMWKMTIDPGNWKWFILAYLLAMAPFLLFRLARPYSTRTNLWLLVAVFIGILTMAPLFVVATDWGRWIAMYVFGLTLLTITALRLKLIEERIDSLGPLFLIYGLFWSMPEAGYTHTTWGMLEYFRRGMEFLGN